MLVSPERIALENTGTSKTFWAFVHDLSSVLQEYEFFAPFILFSHQQLHQENTFIEIRFELKL